MSGLAVTREVQRTELDAGAVLKEAWALYTRLWTRSIVAAGLIFGLLHLLELVVQRGRSGLLVVLVTLIVAVLGTGLVQGALVEVVRELHDDGDDAPSALEALARAGTKLGRLAGVTLVQSLGVGIGLLVFVVPGLLAMTRWAVAVPVAVIEGRKTAASLRRAKEILAGNGWNVFKVIFAVGVLTFLVTLPFAILARSAGPAGWWVATTLASMLVAPYAAHALTVVYYALVEPERAVALDPGQRWHSVWDEPRAGSTPDSVWAEYERKFDEHEARWSR